MKRCLKCYRFSSSRVDRCTFCGDNQIEELEFEFSKYNPNYTIYTHEIMVDDRPFQVIESIGRGGFGRVIKIFDTARQKHFAVKVPLIFDEIFSNQKGKTEKEMRKSLEFLENEIATLADVVDDAFIYRYEKGTVHTSLKGKDTSFPVLLMELAECTLEEIIKYAGKGKGYRIAFEEKIKMIEDSLNAISRLHKQNLVHRDLSPDNLFAVDRANGISYVLGDFGAAKSLSGMEAGSPASEVVGHNAYLDPCRYNKKYNRDFRLDIYASGIIITEILMGKSWMDVMGKENIHDFMAVDFEKEFLLQAGAQYIPGVIVEALRRAVKRNIEERYPTIDDFRETLFPALAARPAGEPVTAAAAGAPAHIITFPFYFTIKLPFESVDTTFSQEIIQFEEGQDVRLADHRGAKIVFSDCLLKRVRVTNTSLYSAVVSGNAILLNFLNSKYLEIERLLADFEEAAGELHFKGMIEAEKVSW